MTAKSKPAEPVERLHQLELQVSRLMRTLAEVNNDEELVRLIREMEDYRFSPWNFAVVLGCLTHNARLLFEKLEADQVAETGKGFDVVSGTLPHGHPERIKPLRVWWPLCRHEDPASPDYIDADVLPAMRAVDRWMDHSLPAGDPLPVANYCGHNGGQGIGAGHVCRCVRTAGHPLDSERPHGCECGALWADEVRQ